MLQSLWGWSYGPKRQSRPTGLIKPCLSLIRYHGSLLVEVTPLGRGLHSQYSLVTFTTQWENAYSYCSETSRINPQRYRHPANNVDMWQHPVMERGARFAVPRCKGVRCPPIFSLSNLIAGTNRKAYLLHASFALKDSHCQ